MKYFLILFLLSGCAAMKPNKVWYKPGTSQDTMLHDTLTCRQFGMQQATLNGLAQNSFVEFYVDNRVAECMASLGYR